MAMAADLAIAVLTGGVGWIVWTALLAKKGQTPAKKLRDHVVIGSQTAQVAGVGRFSARESLVSLMFLYVVVGAVGGFGLILDVGGYWINTWVIPITALALISLDIAWIFTPSRRRLVDVILSTNVVYGEGYSYRSASGSAGVTA